MNDEDAWIFLDGEEPESIRPILDACRGNLPPLTPQDKERIGRQFREKLDAVREARRSGARAGEDQARDAASVRPDMVRRVPDDGATVRSPTLDERLQAAPEQSVAEQSAPEQSAAGQSAPALPMPPAMAPPPALAITKQSLDLSPEARKHIPPLNPSPPRPPPGEGVARTTELSVVGRVQTPSPTGSTVGVGVGSYPTLNVKQYASFFTDLAFWPAHVAETFRKYGVKDEAARAAMDEEWRTQFAKLPTLGAEFAQARAEYEAWLWARRG